DLEFDVERAGRLIRRVEQIGQRGRISCWPCGLCHPERRQRFGRDDPRRDRGAKALAEEGAEWLGFPSLDIPRGPIVEQAESADMIRRIRNGNRRAERVAGTDPNAKLELVVEAARGAEARNGLACGLALAVRAAQRGAGDCDGGGAAVITDR